MTINDSKISTTNTLFNIHRPRYTVSDFHVSQTTMHELLWILFDLKTQTKNLYKKVIWSCQVEMEQNIVFPSSCKGRVGKKINK